MSGFAEAFEAMEFNEGDDAYSNNPADPGGETRYGCTARVARAWGYVGPMKALPLETARWIAKNEYWDKYQCDQFDPRIGFQVFDAAYNGGPAAKWLQHAAGMIRVDGIIGAETIKAVRAEDPLKIIGRFNAYRLKYLSGLSAWPTFGRGWANRIADNLLKGTE